MEPHPSALRPHTLVPKLIGSNFQIFTFLDFTAGYRILSKDNYTTNPSETTPRVSFHTPTVPYSQKSLNCKITSSSSSLLDKLGEKSHYFSHQHLLGLLEMALAFLHSALHQHGMQDFQQLFYPFETKYPFYRISWPCMRIRYSL